MEIRGGRTGTKGSKVGYMRCCFVVALGAALVPALAWCQQSYSFTKVLDNATLRPDRNQFKIGANAVTAFDGQWVVFRDYGTWDDGSLQAIFSFNAADKTFHNLVNLGTAIPGGGTFTDLHLLDTAPTVRNGVVVFLGRNTANSPIQEGLYAVPAAGGAITKIADYKTADPGGGTFELFDSGGLQTGGFFFDGTTAAFHGQGPSNTGIYSGKADGSPVALIADSAHPFVAGSSKVLNFSAPLVSGGNVVFAGADSSDPTAGYNGLYLGQSGSGGALTELLNSTQKLPGAGAVSHTRFDAPYSGFDGNVVAFRAEDSSTAPAPATLYGLYWTDLASHALSTIADVNSTLTGLGKLKAIADQGVAVSKGHVLFRAADITTGYPGNNGLYLWDGANSARIVGTGDKLDGNTVQVVHDPGPAALFGVSFAFVVEFGQSSNFAIYVATPVPGAGPVIGSVNNSSSYASGSVAPGEIVALFGSGLGPSTLATFALDASGRIPASLSGVQVTFNGVAAPIIYASSGQTSVIAPFELAGQSTAQVVVQYNGVASAPVTVSVTNTLPGLFSANASGQGQGAIQNADFSLNSSTHPAAAGSIIVLWVSGLGALNPAAANGSIIPATNTPTLRFAPTVTIGGKTAQIAYAGPGPLSVAGLYEINCTVPAGLPSGPSSVVITSDGRQSQANLTVAIQ